VEVEVEVVSRALLGSIALNDERDCLSMIILTHYHSRILKSVHCLLIAKITYPLD
jgi:hypothetical protein